MATLVVSFLTPVNCLVYQYELLSATAHSVTVTIFFTTYILLMDTTCTLFLCLFFWHQCTLLPDQLELHFTSY